MNKNILSVKNLSLGYKKPILESVSFDCPQGAFVALLGPNGAGKTTLLRGLSNHLRPFKGTIELLGLPLSSYKALDLAKIVSVVMTDKASPPLLKVWEFVALGRYPHTGFLGRLNQLDLEKVTKTLLDVRALDLSERFVEELSDGERQKATLARALAQEPKLMLLDEPTAHLDLKHRMEVMGILRSLCRVKNITVVAAIHDVDAAAKVADLILTLKDGALTSCGPPHRVLTPPSVSKLYDFEQAGFSSRLGAIEIRGDGLAGQAFVLSRSDHGAEAFRLLSKRGYQISCGFFPSSDLDAHVARALGAKSYEIETDVNNSESILNQASKDLKEALFVVDAYSQTQEGLKGDGAQESQILSQKLLKVASEAGLKIIKLGPQGDIAPLIDYLDAESDFKLASAQN
ncbi:MAG: ABC transporter ATP-binding protein [Deltaproteobacteria bacterium]|jgi:iron complex transport system ATP-binding protein|nr:ABC transporter ATP-binding protein [Deltaproteobacteria bacterium]